MLVMPTGWELTTKVRTNTQVCMPHDTVTTVYRQPRMFTVVRPFKPTRLHYSSGAAGYAVSPAKTP